MCQRRGDWGPESGRGRQNAKASFTPTTKRTSLSAGGGGSGKVFWTEEKGGSK